MPNENSSAPLKIAEGAAPPSNLPSWEECQLRVGNSEFIAKRIAEGGYGAEHDSKLATELHRFIHEYDDADSYRSAWFRHRLEKLLHEVAAQAVEAQAPAAVAVPCGVCGADEAFTGSCGGGRSNPRALCFERAALAATPALPATEDSSAGDLAEVQAEPVSSDPVAWHSKLYGTCWMHKQPYHLDAGTHFFVRGNPNPVATVLSGAAIQWHTGTAAFEHGTFFYTAPQAQPASVQAEPVAEARVSQDAAGKKTVELELRYGDLPSGTHLLFTAPQAQPADALDAARYRHLRDNCVREWVSRLESTKGKKTLDIEFDADGHDLDSAIDAAMAAAQEGGNAAKEA